MDTYHEFCMDKLKTQNTTWPTEPVCRLQFPNHLELILSKISLFQYYPKSAQTTFMLKDQNDCFHNSTFFKCHY